MKHFAFHARQRKNRQIDNHDDHLSVNQRAPYLLRGCKHQLQPFFPAQCPPQPCLFLRKTADAVLDDDDDTIDDDAKIQRPQTHQVGTDMIDDHAAECKQHRQRDDECRDHRRTKITEKQEQYDDDERGAFDQIAGNGMNRAVDQCGSIINRNDHHPSRQ